MAHFGPEAKFKKFKNRTRFSEFGQKQGSWLFFVQKEIFVPGCVTQTASESRFETWFLATAEGHGSHGPRSHFSRPQCVAFPGALPLRTWTGLFLGSSRPSCMPGAPPAALRRARGVTSREVSRCNVAAPVVVVETNGCRRTEGRRPPEGV